MKGFIIHRPQDTDRDAFVAAAKAVAPALEVLPGSTHEDGVVACCLAHQAAVREAKFRQLPYVWILEDDVFMLPEFSLETWQNRADWLQNSDFSLVLGSVLTFGHVLGQPAPNLLEIDYFTGLHCYLLRADAYDHFLSGNPASMEPVQRWADAWMSKLPIRKAVCAPFLAVSRDGWSVSQRIQLPVSWYFKTSQRKLLSKLHD